MSIIHQSYFRILMEDVWKDTKDAEPKRKFVVFFQTLFCILVGTFDYVIAIKLDYIYHRGTLYQTECIHGYSKYVILMALMTLCFLICAACAFGFIAVTKYLLMLKI